MNARTLRNAGALLLGSVVGCAGIFGIDTARLVLDGGSPSEAGMPDAGDASPEVDDSGNPPGDTGSPDADAMLAPPTVIGRTDASLGGLTAGQGVVFWTDPVALYGANLSMDAGGPFVVATFGASGLTMAQDLGWSGERVAFAASVGGAGTMWSCPPAAGCNATNVERVWWPTVPRASPAGFYCASSTNGIFGCSAASCGTNIALEKDGPFVDLAVDDVNAYWVTGGTNGQVRWTSLGTIVAADAGATANVLASGQNQPVGIAVDGTGVTWTTLGDGKVQRCSLPPKGCSGSPNVLYAGAGVETPKRIVSDGTNVYWIDGNAQTVVSCPIATGCPSSGPRILASNLIDPERLALQSGRVIVADWGSGQVLSVPAL